MKKEKYFEIANLKNNNITLKQLKRLNKCLVIEENEMIVSKIGINSEFIIEPARFEFCQHIEVIEYENLKKFIINHGMCPYCQLPGNIDQIYVDSFLKNIFNLIRNNEENYIIIDFNKFKWKLASKGAKYQQIKYNMDDKDTENNAFISNNEYFDLDFCQLYDILNKENHFDDRIFKLKRSIIELPENV